MKNFFTERVGRH